MLRTVSAPRLAPPMEIEGTAVLTREQLFTRKIAAHARLLWPKPKTAAQWAARAGCSERFAKYWLEKIPKRDLSLEGFLAVVSALADRD